MTDATARLIAHLVQSGFEVSIVPSMGIAIAPGITVGGVDVKITKNGFSTWGHGKDIQSAFTFAAERVREYTEIWDRGLDHAY